MRYIFIVLIALSSCVSNKVIEKPIVKSTPKLKKLALFIYGKDFDFLASKEVSKKYTDYNIDISDYNIEIVTDKHRASIFYKNADIIFYFGHGAEIPYFNMRDGNIYIESLKKGMTFISANSCFSAGVSASDIKIPENKDVNNIGKKYRVYTNMDNYYSINVSTKLAFNRINTWKQFLFDKGCELYIAHPMGNKKVNRKWLEYNNNKCKDCFNQEYRLYKVMGGDTIYTTKQIKYYYFKERKNMVRVNEFIDAYCRKSKRIY